MVTNATWVFWGESVPYARALDPLIRGAAPLMSICSVQGHPGRIQTVSGTIYDVISSNPVWKVVEPLAHEKLKVVMNYLTS